MGRNKTCLEHTTTPAISRCSVCAAKLAHFFPVSHRRVNEAITQQRNGARGHMQSAKVYTSNSPALFLSGNKIILRQFLLSAVPLCYMWCLTGLTARLGPTPIAMARWVGFARLLANWQSGHPAMGVAKPPRQWRRSVLGVRMGLKTGHAHWQSLARRRCVPARFLQ